MGGRILCSFALIEACRQVMREWYIEGSDPGTEEGEGGA